MDLEDGFDGYINRNIRLAMTLIDLSKPYISINMIEKKEFDGVAKLVVDF